MIVINFGSVNRMCIGIRGQRSYEVILWLKGRMLHKLYIPFGLYTDSIMKTWSWFQYINTFALLLDPELIIYSYKVGSLHCPTISQALSLCCQLQGKVYITERVMWQSLANHFLFMVLLVFHLLLTTVKGPVLCRFVAQLACLTSLVMTHR